MAWPMLKTALDRAALMANALNGEFNGRAHARQYLAARTFNFDEKMAFWTVRTMRASALNASTTSVEGVPDGS